ncbi:MAG TPA: S-layer homology domain-containing protein, partial [Thermoleophilia bacterium]|nr:S-layer homology domain-containing protein [Thermoleophilia bacterium]
TIPAATFSDVPSGAGYPFVYVEAAAAAGIVKGFPTATPSEVPRFGPYENVLRIQVAQMLARAGSEKLDPPPPGIVHPFYDAPSYAEAELAPIWQMGIIKGRSSVVYDPWTPATRGQVAEMLFRLRSVFQARP